MITGQNTNLIPRLCGLLLSLMTGMGPASAYGQDRQTVSLELVLLVDVSASVNDEEYRLQPLSDRSFFRRPWRASQLLQGTYDVSSGTELSRAAPDATPPWGSLELRERNMIAATITTEMANNPIMAARWFIAPDPHPRHSNLPQSSEFPMVWVG